MDSVGAVLVASISRPESKNWVLDTPQKYVIYNNDRKILTYRNREKMGR